MSDERFDPYDDSVPISARMGMQRLAEPRPDPPDPDLDLRLDPEPDLVDPQTGVVSLSKRRKKVAATAEKGLFDPVQLPNTVPDSKSERDTRELASTACELLGLSLFAAGFWVLSIWAGLIVTGICLVAFGVATSNQFTVKRD